MKCDLFKFVVDIKNGVNSNHVSIVTTYGSEVEVSAKADCGTVVYYRWGIESLDDGAASVIIGVINSEINRLQG